MEDSGSVRQLAHRRLSSPPLVYLRVKNDHGVPLRLHRGSHETGQFELPVEQYLPPHGEIDFITVVGCRIEVVTMGGNFLYVSLHSGDDSAPRVMHFRPTEEHHRETSESNPLLLHAHLSRMPVHPDLTSVDPLGRPLHSLVGDTLCPVAFHNRSSRKVAMFWFSYDGMRVHYGDIRPGDVKYMETFVTHPWEFVDRANNVSMCVNDGSRDADAQSRYFFPRESEGRRYIVTITSPMYSLRTLAINVIRTRIEKREIRLDPQHVPEPLIEAVLRSEKGPNYLYLNEIANFNQPLPRDM